MGQLDIEPERKILMHLIVCLDERGGMAFNHRRQSRDRAVAADILAHLAGQPLWLAPASAALFGEAAPLRVAEDVLAQAPDDACCFVETGPLAPYAARIDRLTVYRWHRHYPADVHFDLPLEKWRLVSARDFAGHSHETITREDYKR